MLERVGVVLAVGALVVLAVVAVRAWNGRRLRRVLATETCPILGLFGEAPDGRPTLVTFFDPVVCRVPQRAGASRGSVEQLLGAAEVRVIRVDAARRPEIARVFGVQTVPSTVVLAPGGRVVAVNQGFAPSGRLVEQLQRDLSSGPMMAMSRAPQTLSSLPESTKQPLLVERAWRWRAPGARCR